MRCSQAFSPLHLTVSIFILIVSTPSQLRSFTVQGRKLTPTDHISIQVNEDRALIFRGEIGSRPPQCERRCRSCASDCEAIQVPTDPQTNTGARSSTADIAGGRDEDSSNYKPMSWKCRCGNIVLNP